MKEKERMLDNNNMTLKLENMSKKSMNKHQISRSKLSKKKSLKERGITLIALVVTIIILLILAGVTLNIALSDNGLFSKTQEAAEKYKQAQSNEEEMIRQIATQMYSEYVGATVTGYTPIGTNCEIENTTSGHTDTQKFEKEDLNWRVWDFDGNTLRIIGDPTTTKLTLKGPAGYNNGVWAINHICEELYANDRSGVTATNLKRTDIQKVSTYDYTQYKHNPGDYQEVTGADTENIIHFGESKTYSAENAKYPDMWDENDKEWTYGYSKDTGITGEDKEGTTWEVIGKGEGKMDNDMNNGDENTTFKQSFYSHDYKQSEFINDEYYNLIFNKFDGKNTGIYWLAGRYMDLDGEDGGFGIHTVNGPHTYNVSGYDMFNSNSTPYNFECALRPIVSIDLKASGCTLTETRGTDGIVTCNLEWNE